MGNTKSVRSPQKVHYKKLSDLYKRISVLGQGSFAVVYKCVRKSDKKIFAVKCIAKGHLTNQKLENRVKEEIALIGKIEHRHCARMYEMIETKSKFCIVTELMEGPTLYDHIARDKSFSEHMAAQIVYQVIDALAYLHRRNIIHRDLKPHNIMLRKPIAMGNLDVCILDFGMSKNLATHRSMTLSRCGTPQYIAPEVLEVHESYSYSCDMWSLGVIIYEMLSGHLPFFAPNEPALWKLIKAGNYSKEQISHLSPEAKDIISKLLVTDHRKRLTDIQAQSHPWVATENKKVINLRKLHIKVARRRFQRCMERVLRIISFLSLFFEEVDMNAIRSFAGSRAVYESVAPPSEFVIERQMVRGQTEHNLMSAERIANPLTILTADTRVEFRELSLASKPLVSPLVCSSNSIVPSERQNSGYRTGVRGRRKEKSALDQKRIHSMDDHLKEQKKAYDRTTEKNLNLQDPEVKLNASVYSIPRSIRGQNLSASDIHEGSGRRGVADQNKSNIQNPTFKVSPNKKLTIHTLPAHPTRFKPKAFSRTGGARHPQPTMRANSPRNTRLNEIDTPPSSHASLCSPRGLDTSSTQQPTKKDSDGIVHEKKLKAADGHRHERFEGDHKNLGSLKERSNSESSTSASSTVLQAKMPSEFDMSMVTEQPYPQSGTPRAVLGLPSPNHSCSPSPSPVISHRPSFVSQRSHSPRVCSNARSKISLPSYASSSTPPFKPGVANNEVGLSSRKVADSNRTEDEGNHAMENKRVTHPTTDLRHVETKMSEFESDCKETVGKSQGTNEKSQHESADCDLAGAGNSAVDPANMKTDRGDMR